MRQIIGFISIINASRVTQQGLFRHKYSLELPIIKIKTLERGTLETCDGHCAFFKDTNWVPYRFLFIKAIKTQTASLYMFCSDAYNYRSQGQIMYDIPGTCTFFFLTFLSFFCNVLLSIFFLQMQ